MTFTVDWFSEHIPNWERLVLPRLGSNPSYLEIGSYEGRSLCWMLDNVPNLKATSIDPHMDGSYNLYCENLKGRNVRTLQERSDGILPKLKKCEFTAIYIDGSHWSHDVLSDTILAWPLLKTGGVMVWDDYGWLIDDDPIKGPKAAIDAFLTCYRTQYKVLHIGYQFMVEKL